MTRKFTTAATAVFSSGLMMAQTMLTGPSTTTTPYVQPVLPNYTVTSILTTLDVVNGYTMCGTPDGLGAFDNGNGTFTLLMNHEFVNTAGATHAHGNTGAFVSKWVINKSTLAVISGADLIQNLNLWNGTGYTTYNSGNTSTLSALSRFCSADLAPASGLYNDYTGLGTRERIFMNGEENGNEGRLFAHVATGPNAGSSYELSWLGKFSCENLCACPNRNDKTIVGGMDDSSPGQVYFYVGNKTATGNEITRAGLVGGKLYGVAVIGLINEVSASIPAANTSFTLIEIPNAAGSTGAVINANSNSFGVTNFLRPEDGAWDPANPRDFYFNTTNAFNSPSRLWRLRFKDINNPELGGTITAVLDGTEGQQMLDNLTIDNSGHAYLVEDVGNNAHNGKVWMYDFKTDVLTQIGQHDPSRFISGGANFLTQDEEASGILDVQSILGPGKFICVDQAHYSIPGAAVEGGQLFLIDCPVSAAANPEVAITGNGNAIVAGTTLAATSNLTDFGSVNTGNSLTQTYNLTNSGTGALVVSSMMISGANAGDFTVVSPVSFPVTVAAGGTLSLMVKFSPAFTGMRSAMVSVINNDLDESFYNFAVKGNGTTPEINITGNAMVVSAGNMQPSASNLTDFGQIVYNTNLTHSFVIENNGTGVLTISNISLQNAATMAFSVATVPSLPLTLAAGSSVTVPVTFMPVVPGVKTATMMVMSDDLDEGNYSFKLQGEGMFDTGVQNNNTTLSGLSLYPNPTGNETVLQLNAKKDGVIDISVYNVAGQLVMSHHVDARAGNNEFKVNTTLLSNGLYMVKVKAGSEAGSLRLIVQH